MRYRPSFLATRRFRNSESREEVDVFVLPALWEGKRWGATLSRGLRAGLPKCQPDRISGSWHCLQTLHRPAVERDHRPADTPRHRDLAQRAPTLTDRDHALRRGDDEDVASLAHPRRQRDGEVRAGALAIVVGQDSDHSPPGTRGALARSAGDSA